MIGNVPRPIVVDLEGAVARTDLLHERVNHFIVSEPLHSYRLICPLLKGRAALESYLAENIPLDPATLPYNPDVMSWLREQKCLGRCIVMATCSHLSLSHHVTQHLGIFEEVLAIEDCRDQNPENRRAAITRRFGNKGFEYIGSNKKDILIWRDAYRAHVASGSSTLISEIKAMGNLGTILHSDRGAYWKTAVRAMRPYQWTKNLLVFVPLLAAHQYGDGIGWLLSSLAFVVFGLTTSSVYLLNDLVDLTHDRMHQRKRHRPFASGEMSIAHGWMIWPMLLLMAFTLSMSVLPPIFVSVMAAYVVITLAYSFVLKSRAIIDVLTLAGLYTLRIIAGASAIDVPLSFWLLSFSMFIFLSLAFVKRFSELHVAREGGSTSQIRGRGYAQGDSDIVSSLGTASGYLSVLVLALYIQDEKTSELYALPELIWLACPLVLYWISRTWIITYRGQMHDDPILFALKDRTSWIVGACVLAVFGLARIIG